MSYMGEGFEVVKAWMNECVSAWQGAWESGILNVIDESMVQWAGATAGHITFLPRKPTPLGFLLLSMSCASSGVCIMAELCEGAEVDRLKAHVPEYGHRTAVTMRMCAPIAHKSKTLVADAWFGSVKCAVVLRESLGTYV
jgi:hypothetical protein